MIFVGIALGSWAVRIRTAELKVLWALSPVCRVFAAL